MQPAGTLRCPKCSGEVRDGWMVCPACATPLAAEAETETAHLHTSPLSSSSSVEEGRFPAGTVLAGRYRILGLLGHGGMGEVYRAYDLILNQAVALKFLAAPQLSEAALARFRNEVRIARQVSHPNVCRVYDIGFVEGFHFLSMEYLDGEDLDSLLRRIGRLPQDKAIEFTRKICAGLAAAHERGVLHRDLKPSNIMIDGRGQVRIADFGLAGLAVEIPLSDLRSGTPAYMSPEQKAGKEVTTRSDLYSLGLVLYEMFTGKRRTSTESNPTDLVKDLDPAVERVILRCLEEDPKRRPSAALNVAMALPGGDPIAAALAAGETPSPEMVAASGEKEGFSARTAILCFVGIVASIGLAVSTLPNLFDKAQINIPPEALAFRARDILKQLGYAEQPSGSAYGFDCCDAASLRFAEQQGSRRDAILASHQPPVLRFWYRQHYGSFWAGVIAPVTLGGVIDYNSPPNTEPGMIRLALDANGKLIALEARPLETEASGAPNWTALFAAAGLDPARFTPVSPTRVPPMAADTRMAWTGTYGEGRPEHVHVEAASWQGRPVFLDIDGDWRPQVSTALPASGPPPVVQAVFNFLLVFGVVGGALVARHNLRIGRGDRQGAGRVAGAFLVVSLCTWLLRAAHEARYLEIGFLASMASLALLPAGILWLAYLAVEPYMRRHWPDSLISWNRLLAGRLRDPLIASHLLAGFLLWASSVVLTVGRYTLMPGPLTAPPALTIQSLNSPGYFAAGILSRVTNVLMVGIGIVLIVVLLRLLLRRVWIADVVGSILFGFSANVDFSNPYRLAASGAINTVVVYLWLWLLRRFGLVAVLAVGLAVNINHAVPPPSLTSWYAGRSIVGLSILVAIPAWALWVILSAKRRTESAPV
ncbi:MAG TPA: serine/threonine-protein kinase [Bryobacteraceae bacterium]|nr:serine/threonine-protein kinase [Bryobacteraceae bacterium]